MRQCLVPRSCVTKPLAGPMLIYHDDVIKWKKFPCYWPFVRGIHRSPVNSLHKGHWRGALMFSLICAWINGWLDNLDAGDLRRHRAHYDVIAMIINKVQWHSTGCAFIGRCVCVYMYIYIHIYLYLQPYLPKAGELEGQIKHKLTSNLLAQVYFLEYSAALLIMLFFTSKHMP